MTASIFFLIARGVAGVAEAAFVPCAMADSRLIGDMGGDFGAIMRVRKRCGCEFVSMHVSSAEGDWSAPVQFRAPVGNRACRSPWSTSERFVITDARFAPPPPHVAQIEIWATHHGWLAPVVSSRLLSAPVP